MKQDRTGHRDPRPDRTDAADIEPRVRRADGKTSSDDPTSPVEDPTSPADDTSQGGKPARATNQDQVETPAPGIRHMPEPDAENIIPVKDEPGTL